MELARSAAGDGLLAAWVCVARAPIATHRYWSASVQALLEATTENPELSAPVLALDLLPLLLGERRLGAEPVPAWPRSIRAALRAYEDHVLCPLLADPRWSPLCDALGSLPPAARPAAVGLVAARVLGRLGQRSDASPTVAAVRRLAARAPAELLSEGRSALATEPVAALVSAELLRLAGAARERARLLFDADVFLVEHLPELRGLAARVALVQLADLADRVDTRLPRHVRLGQRPPGLDAAPPSDDSLFPMGGYASLTLTGAPERMLDGELAAMDPAPGERPDLFDVRLVQGELLAYARDEGVALRRRRSLVLVFDPSLARTRALDAGRSAQRLQWLCATCAVVARRLLAQSHATAADVELAFPAEEGSSPLSEEASLLRLLLGPRIGPKQLRFSSGPARTLADELARRRRRTLGHDASVVLLSTEPGGPIDRELLPDAVVDVSCPAPSVRWRDAGSSSPLPGESRGAADEDVWARAAERLLAGPERASRPLRGPS